MTKTNTKHIIYKTARALFLKHGFRQVSVKDICRQAGISRKTYYEYYKDKTSLIKDILDGITGLSTRIYKDIMESDAPFSVKFAKILKLKVELIKQMNVAFTNDILTARDRSVRNYFNTKLEQNRDLLLDFYSKAQEAGKIRNDISVEVIIQIQNHLLELFKNESFRDRFPDIQTMIMQVSDLYLFGISSRKIN